MAITISSADVFDCGDHPGTKAVSARNQQRAVRVRIRSWERGSDPGERDGGYRIDDERFDLECGSNCEQE
jgi:hypothetical protein